MTYCGLLPTVSRIGAGILPNPGVPGNGMMLVSYLGLNGPGPKVLRCCATRAETNACAASVSLGVAEAVVSTARPATTLSSSASPPKTVTSHLDPGPSAVANWLAMPMASSSFAYTYMSSRSPENGSSEVLNACSWTGLRCRPADASVSLWAEYTYARTSNNPSKNRAPNPAKVNRFAYAAVDSIESQPGSIDNYRHLIVGCAAFILLGRGFDSVDDRRVPRSDLLSAQKFARCQ